MAADFPYERPKSVETNTTPINMDILAGEKPTAPAALAALAGTTGVLDVVFTADADESGGADVQNWFRLTLTPVLPDNSNTKPSMQITLVPVLGDGTDGVTQTLTAEHDESMDAWQAAAGRPRQA